MNKSFLCVSLGLLAFCGGGSAAEKPVKFPEGDATWTVVVTYPKEMQVKRIMKAEVTRKAGSRWDRFWWSDSAETEVWLMESAKVRIFENPHNREIYVVPFNDTFMTVTIPKGFDETLFSWVVSSLLVGTENYKGRSTQVYEGKISQKIVGADGKPQETFPIPQKAWIDIETRLPLAIENGSTRYEFTFSTPTREPLVMPAKFHPEFDRYLLEKKPSKRSEFLRHRAAKSR